MKYGYNSLPEWPAVGMVDHLCQILIGPSVRWRQGQVELSIERFACHVLDGFVYLHQGKRL